MLYQRKIAEIYKKIFCVQYARAQAIERETQMERELNL